MSRFGLVVATLVAVLSFGCDKNKDSGPNDKIASGLRMVNAKERAADFDQLIEVFKAHYGPYQYKESRLRISIEQLGQDLKAKAINSKTDEEFMGYVMQFGAAMQDGHVQFGIENSASNVKNFSIPVLVQAVEDKAMVMDVTESLSSMSGIKKGDFIISVDGKTPFEWLAMAQKYRRSARELTDRAFLLRIAFFRLSYMTDLLPEAPMAEVKYQSTDGNIVTVSIPWTKNKFAPSLDKSMSKPGMNFSVSYAQELAIDGHAGQMGNEEPFFLTPQTQGKYGFVKAYPSDDARKKFGLKDEKPPIYAALYEFNGKKILLVRQAGYSPDDFSNGAYMKAYMALLSEYEALADVLVLDQTHNPGGSYCADFYNIFAKEGDRQAVQACRADRKWFNDLAIKWSGDGQGGNPFETLLAQAFARVVEKAYDAGEFLSEPIPIFTGMKNATPMPYVWKKPMLVLIDELAGSCGDAFPMLVKTNQRAKLFGQNTMGLGGNVEKVAQLNHSRINIALTRGLFFPHRENGAYEPSEVIENNGVAPDIEYAHTINDIRAGYVNYVKAFSEKALEQIPSN
jgi:C-terminal processing protease CtpA/Prc